MFLLVGLSVYVYSCANQGSPSGGPKDTIPPKLLASSPAQKSINFSGKTLQLTFDERITADKLKRALLIIPTTESKYAIRVRKNELTLKFDEPFEKNTTYTFNFADGVTDVTEKTSASNLKIAFSTGPVIDSIYINGKVTDLYDNKPKKEFLVGLYPISDSLNLLKHKPRYFATTNKEGQFLIENIKNGYYKLLAFHDKNKNLVYDAANEAQGFLPDSVDLYRSLDSVRIQTQHINADSLKFIRAKTSGRYFDAQYNKSVLTYELTPLDSAHRLPVPIHHLVKERRVLRFYPDSEYKKDLDSLGVKVEVYDSLTNHRVDTVFIKFHKTQRKGSKFEYKTLPKNHDLISPKYTQSITFTKPVGDFFLDSLRYRYDTLKTQGVPDSAVLWNENKTQLSFFVTLDQDFLKQAVDTLVKIYSDTTLTDTLSTAKKAYFSQVKEDQVTLTLPKGTFMSIENDTLKAIKNTYTFLSLKSMGAVAGVVETSFSSYTLQLVDPAYHVIEEAKSPRKFDFPRVPPGKYTFRVMIDTNNDGKWSYGNVLKDEAPEKVYFYPKTFDVRADWKMENIQVKF